MTSLLFLDFKEIQVNICNRTMGLSVAVCLCSPSLILFNLGFESSSLLFFYSFMFIWPLSNKYFYGKVPQVLRVEFSNLRNFIPANPS